MILYHIITTYHLLEAIVHKINYKKNEKAILIFPDFGVVKFPQYKLLVAQGFFDEVILFPYEEISHNNYMEDTLNVVKKTISYSMFEFDEIYVAGAQFYFSYYLIINHIPFVFFEEAGGNLSKPEDWIITMHSTQQRNYAIQYGLLNGENKNIVRKLGNLEGQKIGFQDPLLYDFNISKELSFLSEIEIDRLLKFFEVPKLVFADNSIIVMTQHFAGLKMMTYEEQVMMYSLVLDYFASEYNLVFKCHPDDLVAYESIFSKAKIIRNKFPMELLAFASPVLPQAILTISSTGINNVQSSYNKIIKFDVDFQNRGQYAYLHKYFMTNEIVRSIKADCLVFKVGLISSLANKFEELVNAEPDLNKLEDNKIIIIDEINDEKYLEKFFVYNHQTIIFVNSNENCVFEEYMLKYRNDFVVKEIFINGNKELSQFIYIYTKNEKIKQEVYSMEIKKHLDNTNMDVELKNLTDKDLEISVLKGQLEAAENRLLHYIDIINIDRNITS